MRRTARQTPCAGTHELWQAATQRECATAGEGIQRTNSQFASPLEFGRTLALWRSLLSRNFATAVLWASHKMKQTLGRARSAERTVPHTER